MTPGNDVWSESRAKRGLALALVAVLALAGCTSDPLAEDYLSGGNENYISGSGVTEVPAAKRGDAVEFTGDTDLGTTVSRSDYEGQVLVVNFWYAGCPPCRSEASDLAALSTEWTDKGAAFVGVNIYDGAEQSQAFAQKFGIGYPSILDAQTAETRLQFAGSISPNSVPVTFVLDTQGRVAARILGQLPAKSILDTIVRDVVDESA